MDSLETCKRLSCVNSFGRYKIALGGKMLDLDLNGTELALAAVQFLHRSSGTLTSLDVRCISIVNLFIQIAVS